ncbi:MAG: hypothetical protein JWR15_582 [Prosthecobacter sp.]|nr:hypothetical protein [Prosthecobacter sp.]
MNRRFPSARAGGLLLICATLGAVGQTPQLTQAQKEAAAAIEAPKTAVPLPGQLQNAAPPSQPAPPPAVSESSASKMQVLDAVTQKPAVTEVPRTAAPSDKAPVTSSTSTSRQFIVHGKVFETRSAMSTRCEEISAELRKVLNDKEPWVLPVVVVLNTGEEAAKSKAPRISTTISELNFGGFHVQVTINEGPGLSAADLRKEVVRALLAERILRNHQKIATPEGRLLLPDWIMTGVLKAMEYRSDASPSALFSTLFHSGKIYGIEEIIEVSPVELDSLSRTIYETSCCALVLALVDQPSGPQHLNQFLNALASDPRSERELLSAAFPNFAASSSSLNKWWSLQLAALAKPGIGEPFTPAESLKAIEEAITVHYEALPAEVPKNVKLHPFVLPPPLQVVAANEAPAPSSAPATPTRPRVKEATAEAKDEPGADEQKPKRSLLRRMLFLGDADTKESEPKAGDKPTETATAESEKKAEEEKKPGWMGRLFGAGNGEKKVTEKEKAVVVEKPTSKPKAEAEVKAEPEAAKEEKKPSKLNPMNWFRGDKKPAEEKTEDKTAKDKKAFFSPPADFDVARLISPVLADAWQLLAPAAPRQTVDLLKFLKRKPKPEDQTPAPPVTKPAEDDRPPVKKSSKSHTTNPNSKPAAKSKAATTNPNAKPVPAGMVPPAPVPGVSPAPNAAVAAGPELVKVSLPLEEYQHILKNPDRSKILSFNIASLRALELRVSVLFRPVVTAYLAAVLDLEAGKTKDMDKRLAVLHEFALVAYQKSIAVRDYLDWFEASESGGLSGKFNDFLNLPATIKKELPPRTDPISKYLDAIDKEFSQ